MFTQSADGRFTVEVGGEFHCGPDHTTPKNFGWAVTIDWDDTTLDQHGFLLDNMGFRDYFNKLQFTTDSCELLAIKSAKHFKALAPLAHKVSVSITVPGLATITNTQL